MSRGAADATGGQLSNTWTTCRGGGDNFGKLRLILYSRRALERPPAKRALLLPECRAPRWVCGGLGCWRGNGPPSPRSVSALREGAGRWILRQRSRSYGTQQLQKLRNARKRDGGTPSAIVQQWLLASVKNSSNKGWVRPVPAAAVTPAARVVVESIGLKAFVVGCASPLLNPAA